MDYLTARDWDGYAQLFSAAGALDMAEGVVTGRPAIHARMANASARMSAVPVSPQRQRTDLLSNVRVRVDGDRAAAQSRFTFIAEDELGNFNVTGSGLYTDTWIREEGQWRILRRKVDWDLLAGASPRN